MGVTQSFGGDWTEAKLARLKDYLRAYRNIFTQNEKARYFRTWYVDAFAGTGSRTSAILPHTSIFAEDPYASTESAAFRDGSAKIALSLEKPFDRYLFIEKVKSKADRLDEVLKHEFPHLSERSEVRRGDANRVLLDWCAERDWKKDRAVVFLDPFGMQVDWKTVETLGDTKAVDLWYLFPLGIARMLPRDGVMEEGWPERLDALFGTPEWRTRFLQRRVSDGLFGPYEELIRDVSVETIQAFIEERLSSCFCKTAPSLVLRNSNNGPLFALCFAAANEKGAPIATKIASSLLKE